MQKDKGFTLIEMVVVVLILSILSFFLYNLFSDANKVATRTNVKHLVYEQQINLYRTITEDINSSFLTSYTDDFRSILTTHIATIPAPLASELQNLNTELATFNGTSTEFSFIVKKGDSYVSDQYGTPLVTGDTGVYKVTFKIDLVNKKLIRELRSDFSATASTLNTPGIDLSDDTVELVYETSNITFNSANIAYDYVSGLIPDKIEITIEMKYKEDHFENMRDIKFRHVIAVR